MVDPFDPKRSMARSKFLANYASSGSNNSSNAVDDDDLDLEVSNTTPCNNGTG